MWVLLAFCSAGFAALVSVLGKKGLVGVSSSIATAIRSSVALLLACVVVAMSGGLSALPTLEFRAVLFLLLSGLATGFSWICYFRALSVGRVTEVIAIDRLSLLFTGIAAILLFDETQHLTTKVVGLTIVVAGTFALIAKNNQHATAAPRREWMPWALASMGFAVATTLLAKYGLADVDSSLATAIRTLVVVLAAFAMVAITGETHGLRTIDRKRLSFLVASGLATGASWLCYFGAIKLGPVSVVAPIDKLSILFAALLAYWLLDERPSRRDWLGLGLLVLGTLLLLL